MTLSEHEEREWRLIAQALILDGLSGPRGIAVPRRGRAARTAGWVLFAMAVLIVVVGVVLLVVSVLLHDSAFAINGH